jgi:hypothetical protein
MSFKSLEDTFIYNHLNQSGAVTRNVMNILNNGQILTTDYLQEAFLIINKNFKFPLKYKIMEELENKNIVMVYSPDNAKLPNCLPFILTVDNNNNVIAVIIVDTYGSFNKERTQINIDPKKLYTILESAYLAKLCFLYDHQVSTRNTVISNGSSIYSNMFIRVLNKKYALNIDKIKMHKVLFLASKFYLINLLGLQDNEMTFNYAIKNCPNGNPFSLKEVNDIVVKEDYKNLSTFILSLLKQELGLGMKDLTVRNYLEAYINMYDSAALLALESFPYFLYNIMAVTNGAYLNNQYVLEDIVNNNGAKIYADLLNIEK